MGAGCSIHITFENKSAARLYLFKIFSGVTFPCDGLADIGESLEERNGTTTNFFACFFIFF